MGRLNRPAKEGYAYRSPRQTNARDLTPNLEEDAVASQRADVERVRRGLEAPAKTAYNRRMQQEAAGRALIRSAGRAGMAGAALQGGYEAGRAIDEATGVGRKMVEKAGPMIDRAVSGDRVKLTKEAQQRADEERDFEKMQKGLREADEGAMREGGKVKGYAKGGSVRGSGCEQRGKTRGKFV